MNSSSAAARAVNLVAGVFCVRGSETAKVAGVRVNQKR